MNKRKLITIILLAMFVISCIGGTYAYFSYQKSLKNVIYTANNIVKIEEKFDPPEEITTGETEFLKTISIKNTGNTPTFVRLFCDFSNYDMKNYCQVYTNGKWVNANDLKNNLPQDWEYKEDTLLGEYYYYTKIVETGKSTTPIFEKVKIIIPDTDEELIQDFDIIAYAESIQTKDKNGFDFETEKPWEDAWKEFLSTGGSSK